LLFEIQKLSFYFHQANEPVNLELKPTNVIRVFSFSFFK